MSTECRVCRKQLVPFMSFGRQPMANAFVNAGGAGRDYFFTLAPAFCADCSLFQLTETPAPERMFHAQYPFFTGSSRHMQEHFQAMAQSLTASFLTAGPGMVVELGCNDGTLLRHFAAAGFPVTGFEPCANVAAVARGRGLEIEEAFFNQAAARSLRQRKGPVSLVVAANVLCHIPQIDQVFAAIAEMLHEQGVLVFEDPYLGDVVARTAFDQIYDEHVFLFSLQAVQKLCARHGLELFAAEPQAVHGGSMRYFVGHRGVRPVTAGLRELLDREMAMQLDAEATYAGFRRRCERVRDELPALLRDLKSQGKRVMGYAATSKSTTIFNYCGIGPELLDCIVDTTPEKQGKLSPGMHIPVVPLEEFHKTPPDYSLLLAWNHSAEIFAKEQDYVHRGGKWILHTPKVGIHAAGGETRVV